MIPCGNTGWGDLPGRRYTTTGGLDMHQELPFFTHHADQVLRDRLPHLKTKGGGIGLSVELWSVDIDGDGEEYLDGDPTAPYPFWQVALVSRARVLSPATEGAAWQVVTELADSVGLTILRERRETEVEIGQDYPAPWVRYALCGEQLPEVPYTKHTTALLERQVVFPVGGSITPNGLDERWFIVGVEAFRLELQSNSDPERIVWWAQVQGEPAPVLLRQVVSDRDSEQDG